MLFNIYQLFSKQVLPKMSFHTPDRKGDFRSEEDNSFIMPVGIAMFPVGENENQDGMNYFDLLDEPDAFVWKSIVASVGLGLNFDNALNLAKFFPTACYKVEVIPLYGDPYDLFKYKYDSIKIAFMKENQHMRLATYGRN